MNFRIFTVNSTVWEKKTLSVPFAHYCAQMTTEISIEATCNSLTFLAFLYENENLTTADFDHVLDKTLTLTMFLGKG